jgi:hypothetical protein
MKKLSKIEEKVNDLKNQRAKRGSDRKFQLLATGESNPGAQGIFQILNNRKSPPGCERSPGISPGGLNKKTIWSSHIDLIINNKEKTVQTRDYKYSNTNNNLKFKVMKKQVFLLMMAFLAVTSAFGQMVHNSIPQPLSCTPGPFTPMAGQSYDYSATATPANGNFTWWATTDVDFIKAGVNNLSKKLSVGTELIAASPNYGQTLPNAGTVSITWGDAILAAAAATPTFVVVQNDATGTNCANNLKVYKINPINGFTVDIKSMDQAKISLGYGAPYSFCVSSITSAKYTGGAIVTDYGTNVMYFEVVAANFTGSYTPSFKVTGLQTGQSVTSLELYTDAAMATPAIATTQTLGVYSPAAPIAVDGSVTNTSTGVSLYVKMTIANGTFENLTGEPITLAVNGINSVGDKDVDNTNCGSQTDFEDSATQTINARPTITAAGGGVFVTP